MARVVHCPNGDIRVTPDPAVLELSEVVKAASIQRAMPEARLKHKLQYHGSLVFLLAGLKALGVKRVTLTPAKMREVERDLRAMGKYEELRHFCLEDTTG